MLSVHEHGNVLTNEFPQFLSRLVASPLDMTLRSCENAILLTDMNGKGIGYNQRFLDFWEIPKSVMESQYGDVLLIYLFDLLKPPMLFQKLEEEMDSDPEAESSKIIELKDGRVFEVHSELQEIEGKAVAKVWSFHDITMRVRLLREWMENGREVVDGMLYG
jgi:PAS domain-containing protein